jgi:hypothetical protein
MLEFQKQQLVYQEKLHQDLRAFLNRQVEERSREELAETKKPKRKSQGGGAKAPKSAKASSRKKSDPPKRLTTVLDLVRGRGGAGTGT